MSVTRSFICIHTRNKVGPRNEPWETLDVTLQGVEYEPSTTTCCVLLMYRLVLCQHNASILGGYFKLRSLIS